MLPEIRDTSPAAIVPPLKEISQGARFHGEEAGTLHSSIWDVTGRKLYLYYKRDFDHPRIFNLDEELAKGSRPSS